MIYKSISFDNCFTNLHVFLSNAEPTIAEESANGSADFELYSDDDDDSVEIYDQKIGRNRKMSEVKGQKFFEFSGLVMFQTLSFTCSGFIIVRLSCLFI